MSVVCCLIHPPNSRALHCIAPQRTSNCLLLRLWYAAQDTLNRFAIRWLLHSLMWGLGGSMDAKGRAELGGVMMRGSGLAPTLDGTDLTSLQVGEYLGVWATVACHGVCGVWRYDRHVFVEKWVPSSGCQFSRRCHPYARKSASHAPLSRMQLSPCMRLAEHLTARRACC